MATTTSLSFWTPVLPVSYEESTAQPSCEGNWFVENYFGCWSKEAAQRDPLDNGRVRLVPNPTTVSEAAVIGLSYILTCGLLPLIMLIAKCILRCQETDLYIEETPPLTPAPPEVILSFNNLFDQAMGTIPDTPATNPTDFLAELIRGKPIDQFLDQHPEEIFNPLPFYETILRDLQGFELPQPTLSKLNEVLDRGFPQIYHASIAPQFVEWIESRNAAVELHIGMGNWAVFWVKDHKLLTKSYDTMAVALNWHSHLMDQVSQVYAYDRTGVASIGEPHRITANDFAGFNLPDNLLFGFHRTNLEMLKAAFR